MRTHNFPSFLGLEILHPYNGGGGDDVHNLLFSHGFERGPRVKIIRSSSPLLALHLVHHQELSALAIALDPQAKSVGWWKSPNVNPKREDREDGGRRRKCDAKVKNCESVLLNYYYISILILSISLSSLISLLLLSVLLSQNE